MFTLALKFAHFNLQVVKVEKKVEEEETPLDSQVDALDLDDLDVLPRKVVLSNEASGGRTGQDIV